MRIIDQHLNPERGSRFAGYADLSREVFEAEMPAKTQLYSVGRACRRLAERGRVAILSSGQISALNIPHEGREKVVMGIANGWPKGKWRPPNR